MRGSTFFEVVAIALLWLCSCGSPADEFVGERVDALCFGILVKPSPSAVVPAGTLVTLSTAKPTCSGGETPEYRFFYRLAGSGTYTELRPWHTEQMATWDTSAVAPGKYEVLVRTRAVGTTATDSSATADVFIGDVCNAVTLGFSPDAPASVGTDISVEANATCTGGTAEYRFLSRPPGGSFNEIRGWDPNPSATWSAADPGPHTLKVETRRVGNATNAEASASEKYILGESCGSLGASTEPASPAPPGTVVTVSADATCSGTASPQFRFSYRQSKADGYMLLRDWGTAASADWDTAGLPAAAYQLRVQTRANDYDGAAQSARTLSFVLGGLCSEATLTASPESPQHNGALVTLTAGATCTGGSPEFQFLVNRPQTLEYEELSGWGGPSLTWDSTYVWSGDYDFVVRVRAVGNTSAYQDETTLRYGIDVCHSLEVAVSPESAQPSGARLAIAVNATCMYYAGPEYRFLYRLVGASEWNELRGWDRGGTEWDTAGIEPGSYQLQVQMRTEWNREEAEEKRNVKVKVLAACPFGEMPDGAGGCVDIEECEPNPCANGGTCLEDAMGYACECPEGFVGPNCETTLWSAVDLGSGTACGVRLDGSAACWGDPSWQPPADEFATVSVGIDHACGMRLDNTVSCWGDNSQGEATPPSGEFADVSSGWDYSLGLRLDGTATPWGLGPTFDPTLDLLLPDPPPDEFTAITLGPLHACGLRTNATVSCWGPDEEYLDVGQSTPPPGDFLQVSAGVKHTCGIRGDGTLSCWGDDTYGQSTPPPGEFVSCDSGYDHACALRSDGTVACWGSDLWGEVSMVPPGEFRAVSAGYGGSCAISLDDRLSCWGLPAYQPPL